MKNTDEEILQAAQNILKSVVIPAQPQTVMELMSLSNNQDVDINQIIKKVEKDPSLTAKVLKIANSPLFGLRRPVDSIGKALNLMGFRTFQRAVLASTLRDVFLQDKSSACETFWIHSEMAACCCEIIAKKLHPELTQQAYLAGLFHDCAFPVLLKRFPDYEELARKVLHYLPEVIKEEDHRYETNHCMIGYMFGRAWHLPESVLIAILRHHDKEPQHSDVTEARILTAILRVSEFIIQDYDTSGNMKTIDAVKWAEIHEKNIDILDIEAENITEFETDFLEVINR